MSESLHWKNDTRKLSELIPWGHNPKRLTQKQGEHLTISIERFGFALPFLIAPDNSLYDGHQRRALMERMHEYGADALVDVRVSSRRLTDDERRELVIRLRENQADWDFDLLGNLYDVDELTEWGFPEWRLAELVPEDETTEGDTEPQVDRAEELREKWQVETGQLWQLGAHRLICGDCTDSAVVERVMGGELGHMIFTDPPYGVDYNGGAKVREKLHGDNLGTSIYANALPILAGAVDDNAPLYLWYADGHAAAAAAAAAAAGYQIVAQIIWAKNHAQFVTSAHYKGKHEPCYYGHKRNKSARWHGPNNEVTLWEYDRASRNDYHPTQKPVEIAERAIKNSTERGQIAIDGFLGSGTTLIACENLGRRCRAIEISPAYVAVALERWAQHTAQTPELVA